MMGTIYAIARKVLVQLGLDPDKATSAFSALLSYSGVDPALVAMVMTLVKDIMTHRTNTTQPETSKALWIHT